MSGPRLIRSVAVIVAVAVTPSVAQQPSVKGDTRSVPASSAPPVNTHSISDGERIFQQNCSRCHLTPTGISPLLTGTVLRHMRVRASLSEHDEKELLRFFNP